MFDLFDNTLFNFIVYSGLTLLFLGEAYYKLGIFKPSEEQKNQSFLERWRKASWNTRGLFFTGHLFLIVAVMSLLDVVGLVPID
ncbi:hypothetical protein [Boudabousia marimammalium]|uniref:Uncharacterized protein n=1 Tax=Boudabousia marimammalium TaxID=156892 RepID=A0A1Q5PSP0_9ACTO|nr:hypothetical protein [Boudabousia marimammalium]OKL50591.1 hypothetical protein BM477_01115 [Boudabousia marimammalium]